MLGDEYISQHIVQSYREYLEQTSYKVYMSNMAKCVASALTGQTIDTNWSDILHNLNEPEETKTETEEEVKTRMLAKLNER